MTQESVNLVWFRSIWFRNEESIGKCSIMGGFAVAPGQETSSQERSRHVYKMENRPGPPPQHKQIITWERDGGNGTEPGK